MCHKDIISKASYKYDTNHTYLFPTLYILNAKISLYFIKGISFVTI